MKKNKTFLIIFLAVFIAVELGFGAAVQLTDGTVYKVLTFTSVAVAVLGAALFFRIKASYLLMLTALICTLCADILLSNLFEFEGRKLIAMCFFSVTQICYFVRLYLNQKSKTAKTVHLIARISLSVIAITATIIVLNKDTDALALVSLFYFANLFMNIIVAFTQFKDAPLFAIGLLLFSCCDIIIGLLQLDNFLPIPEDSFIYKLNEGPIVLAWFFYIPSQTCIVCDVALQSNKN